MTLKLLRNTISKEDELENMRDHISKCFNMDLSTAIARQHHAASMDEPLRRITTQEELEEAERRIKEANRGNIFYQMSKWREYIDQVLDKKKL
jgi:formate dehydrogenase maturation protein FdhE